MRVASRHRIVVDIAVAEGACEALADGRAAVEVGYTVTALGAAAGPAPAACEGERFAAMIDGWAQAIAARRETLLAANLR